jgi:hypothetical protein
VGSALSAQQRDPYAATLHFGTGLINIPVAWVSPTNADVWLQTSGKTITYAPGLNFSSRWNTNISLDSHWLGRFSVGASAYSQNPEWGFFGQALLLKPGQVPFVPAIAVGVRNVGKYDHEDRLLVGHDIELDAVDSTYQEVISSYTDEFKTAPTFYAAATQDFAFGGVGASFTVGYGNGLFKDDGELGDSYNSKGTIAEGLFLGGRVIGHPTLNTSITVLAENDGWDWNAGVVADWRGISLGLYGTELEEGGKDLEKCAPDLRGLCQVYNYAKFNISLGYSGNIVDISRGVLLRSRITDLEREATRLRAEIAARERRIAALEEALRRAQAGERGQRPPANPPATPPTTPPANPPADGAITPTP